MAKLTNSPFTKDLTKTLKTKSAYGLVKISCQKDGSKSYITNGTMAVVVNGREYDILIRPITQRDTGNWTLYIQSGQLIDGNDTTKSIIEKNQESVMYDLELLPLLYHVGTWTNTKYYSTNFSIFYNSEHDDVVVCNKDFVDTMRDVQYKACKPDKNGFPPVATYYKGECCGIIMPLRMSDNTTKRLKAMAKAWYNAVPPKMEGEEA